MRIWLDQVREEPFNWDETQSVPLETLERPELLDLGPVRGGGRWCSPTRVLPAGAALLRSDPELRPVPEADRRARRVRGRADDPGGARPRAAAGSTSCRRRSWASSCVEGEILETDPILIEQLQLNVPMKPLCRPDCKGSAPVCGADRNDGDCSCEEPTGDPRWAALAALKSRLDDEADDRRRTF